MAEAKPRPAGMRPRIRPRTEGPAGSEADERDVDRPSQSEPADMRREDERPPRFGEEEYGGFDEEVNSRYEEIKRGSTHISELQQMTMPQLLKVAREENLTDYT